MAPGNNFCCFWEASRPKLLYISIFEVRFAKISKWSCHGDCTLVLKAIHAIHHQFSLILIKCSILKSIFPVLKFHYHGE